MVTRVKKNTFGSYYWAAVIMLMALVSVTPILERPICIIIVTGLFGLAFFLNIGSKVYRDNLRLIICVLLYYFLIILYRLFDISDASWGNYMTQVFSLVPILIMPIIASKIHNKLTLFVIVILFLIMVFNIANNIRLSIIYPELTLSNMAREEEDLASYNMGSSYFQTFAMLFFDVCLFLFLNIKIRIGKILSLICGIVAAVFVIGFCLKASVVIYLLLSAMLIVIANRAKNVWGTVSLLSLAFVIIALIIDTNKNEVVNFILDNSPDERVAIRFVTLIDPDSFVANDKTMTGRSDLWLLSINTWLKDPANFLLGIGDHRSSFNVEATGIGQHSDVFDTLARYGILGGLLLFIIYIDSFRYILKLYDKRLRSQLFMIMLILVLCAFTKSISYACISCVIFVLLPLLAPIINESKQ